MKRNEIINQIIEEQKKVINSLKDSVERYRTASDLDEESTHDPEDFSQQTQAKDLQLRFEKMLTEAESAISFLESELKENHDKIETGCIIETDKNILFVGISLPAFTMDGTEVICFSEKAPVFNTVIGKAPGEQVQIGDKQYTIKSIG